MATINDGNVAKDLIPALQDQTKALLALTREEWEYSDNYSFGGPQNTYNFQSCPYTVACQWMLLSVAATGAATAMFSSLTQQPIAPTTTLTVGSDVGRNLIPIAFSAAGTIPYGDVWHDFPGQGSMGLNVVSAASALYVTIVFRRRRSQAGKIAES